MAGSRYPAPSSLGNWARCVRFVHKTWNGYVTIFDTLNPLVRIDLSPISTAMGESTFQRRIHLDLFDLGKNIWINSPESLIAVKLSPGFLSERDLKDAKGILLRSKETLDWDELKALCSKYGALEKLHELKRQIDDKQFHELLMG